MGQQGCMDVTPCATKIIIINIILSLSRLLLRQSTQDVVIDTKLWQIGVSSRTSSAALLIAAVVVVVVDVALVVVVKVVVVVVLVSAIIVVAILLFFLLLLILLFLLIIIISMIISLKENDGAEAQGRKGLSAAPQLRGSLNLFR